MDLKEQTWKKFIDKVGRSEDDISKWDLETVKDVAKDCHFSSIELGDVQVMWKKLQGIYIQFCRYIFDSKSFDAIHLLKALRIYFYHVCFCFFPSTC